MRRRAAPPPDSQTSRRHRQSRAADHRDVVSDLLCRAYICGCAIRVAVVGDEVISEGCRSLQHRFAERIAALAPLARSGWLHDDAGN